MLRLGDVDVALAGGVSEAIHSFGIFASFAAENALAWHEDAARACRPFDAARNGIVVSEGGCIFVLERLTDARQRGATILAEIAGYAMNSDAKDPVVPDPDRLAACMRQAIGHAGLTPSDINLVNTHATATQLGDEHEAMAIRQVFVDCKRTFANNTKSYIGHTMGAAGALELAGNLGTFDDGVVHPTINIDDPDPKCVIDNLVANKPMDVGGVEYILNNSFGMLGINSAVVVKRYSE